MRQSVVNNLMIRTSEGIIAISLIIALFIGFTGVAAGCAVQGWG